MRLENQVVSLELSKRLKELGVKQESLWYWGVHEVLGKSIGLNMNWGDYHATTNAVITYSAFTVAELGEILPDGVYLFQKEYGGKSFFIREFDGKGVWGGDTEANARAKILIHLIEKGIVTP